MRTLIIVLSLLVQFQAQANNLCSQLFQKEVVVEELPSFDPKDIENAESSDFALHWDSKLVGQRFLSLFESWNELLGPYEFRNFDFTMSGADVLESYFNPLERSVNLGLDLGVTSVAFRDHVVAHEFHHGVFDSHFWFTVLGIKKTYRELSSGLNWKLENLPADSEVRRLHSELIELATTIEVARDAKATKTVEDLEAMVRTKQARLAELDLDMLLFYVLREIVLPFNELFADSVPTAIFQDPKLYVEFINNPEGSFLSELRSRLTHRENNRVDVASREFALVPFKGWKHEVGDSYTILDPARGYLWKMYIEGMKPEDISRFVKTFLEATSTYVSDQMAKLDFQNLSTDEIQPSPEEMNKKFVRLFVERARKNGLRSN